MLLINVVLWAVYTFILFFTLFMLIVFLEHGTIRGEVEWPDDWPTVSIIVPAYNEEDTLDMTLEALTDLNYPEDLLDIIVVNDGSTDGTRAIAEQYAEQDDITLINQENQGKGAALNTGLEEATGEFVACVDADSRVDPDAIKNIIATFDEDTAAVASAMKVHEPENFLQRLQWVEYIVGIFLRRIMSWIDSITVAPGPLSVYRREVIEDLGGFDEDSIVEDMEIVFRLQQHQWKIGHSRLGEVYTVAPATVKDYYRQRYRWYKGSLNNILRYRNMFLNPDYGDFGMYTLPGTLGQGLLSIVGLFAFTYVLLEPIYTGGRTLVKQVMTLGISSINPSLPLNHLTSYLVWTLLGQNFTSITMIAALFFASAALAYLAVIHTEERLFEHGYLTPFIFLTYYFLAIGLIWLKIVLELLLGQHEVELWR
ncbi:MAG: glycosyltransferase [Candidatus Nanohaloarchaea archaeon]|nr:glycosyltransferase [Candidatus Nanohaloarchaea archaeon]